MMRRQIKLMGWLFVSALAACTSETPNPADGGNAAENVQKLVINLSDGGDRLTTRAGRPLHSSEPGQWVQHVTLYVTNEQGIVLQKEIDEHVWANAVDYSNGKQLEIAFRASDGEQLPKNEYTVYAVAFSNSTDYSILPAPKSETKINAINNGSIDNDKVKTFDFQNEFSAILNSGVADAEEIFAGVATIVSTIDSDGKLCLTAKSADDDTPAGNAVITLNRQVAGTIGYFTNIPAKVGDAVPTRIRLVAANRSDKVWFTSLIGGETVTATDKAGVNWVINGSQSATLPKNAYYYGSDKTTYDAYEIYSIDLREWFVFGNSFADSDLNSDGYVGEEDAEKYIGTYHPDSDDLSGFWKNPNSTTEHPQQLEPGSVFAGRFLIPFSLVSGKETFELQLLGNETGKPEQILKSWRVKVSADGKHDVTDVEVPTGVIVPAADQDYVYNIYRNHMYSIGKKTADRTTDDDDDVPADLNTAQDLIITVNSQWQIVHGMELEPATTQP